VVALEEKPPKLRQTTSIVMNAAQENEIPARHVVHERRRATRGFPYCSRKCCSTRGGADPRPFTASDIKFKLSRFIFPPLVRR
jgi:hypothetical protein